MKNMHIAGALVASALVTAGCNNAAPSAPAANAAAPAAPVAPAPAPAAPAAPSASVSGAAIQNFTVFNGTGSTVMTLNVSATNDENWGPDILGMDVIGSGQSAQVSFERAGAECMWDVRATYDDGDVSELRGVNLCEVGTVNLTP